MNMEYMFFIQSSNLILLEGTKNALYISEIVFHDLRCFKNSKNSRVPSTDFETRR